LRWAQDASAGLASPLRIGAVSGQTLRWAHQIADEEAFGILCGPTGGVRRTDLAFGARRQPGSGVAGLGQRIAGELRLSRRLGNGVSLQAGRLLTRVRAAVRVA